jgi:hypothetical protein
MDIEGGEFVWLDSISQNDLNKIKQIVIEFHGVNNDSWNAELNKKIRCFEKLNRTHYIIHAHGNNHAKTHENMPDVLELTYINKRFFTNPPCYNKNDLPLPNIDFPNCIYSPDINLSFYPFVIKDNIN